MEEEISYPSHFSKQISSVVDIFANYGWYFLFLSILTIYLYARYFKTRIQIYKAQRDEAEYSAKYHKNPDLLSARLLAQEKRAQELQESYKRAAEDHKRKLEEKEQKKLEKLQEQFLEGGHVLGPGTSKSFKPEYNPLMGSGSSSNYKPPKRSACSRGGCG